MVVYYVGIVRQGFSTLEDSSGLFAVEVSDIGGSLVSGSPLRLVLPEAVSFANVSRWGAFSLDPERLALVAPLGGTSYLFMTVAVDRDLNDGSITGLSGFVVLDDFSALGRASPFIDYSSDGSRIVLSISSDLYRVHLSDNAVNGAPELLTPNTDGFAEWNPSYSPDGGRIAYTAGQIGRSGAVRTSEIASLNLASRVATRVTTKRNKGKAASGLDNAMWSADGASIGFSAYTGATPRRAPCSNFVDSEIFLINPDGTGVASALTTTNGSGVEAWPQWGW